MACNSAKLITFGAKFVGPTIDPDLQRRIKLVGMGVAMFQAGWLSANYFISKGGWRSLMAIVDPILLGATTDQCRAGKVRAYVQAAGLATDAVQTTDAQMATLMTYASNILELPENEVDKIETYLECILAEHIA